MLGGEDEGERQRTGAVQAVAMAPTIHNQNETMIHFFSPCIQSTLILPVLVHSLLVRHKLRLFGKTILLRLHPIIQIHRCIAA